jgi:hypothetical protein
LVNYPKLFGDLPEIIRWFTGNYLAIYRKLFRSFTGFFVHYVHTFPVLDTFSERFSYWQPFFAESSEVVLECKNIVWFPVMVFLWV